MEEVRPLKPTDPIVLPMLIVGGIFCIVGALAYAGVWIQWAVGRSRAPVALFWMGGAVVLASINRDSPTFGWVPDAVWLAQLVVAVGMFVLGAFLSVVRVEFFQPRWYLRWLDAGAPVKPYGGRMHGWYLPDLDAVRSPR